MDNRAIINPKMMTWAREYAGFTGEYEELLPKYIKKNYVAWENGEKYPTWNQLQEVSKKFNVPTAFFFMNPVPKFNNIPNLMNYRRLDKNDYKNNSPNLIREIRNSVYRRENYLDLLFELDGEIPKFEIIDNKLGKTYFVNFIREKLEISLDVQKSWIKRNNSRDKNHYAFLNNWKKTITEKMGVLIFETKAVSLDEMRGLCIFNKKVPVILLNGKDSVNGRIFSLFHELTHLLLGESAICDGDDNDAEEIFCNAVAGEFLVPKDDLNCNADVDDLLSRETIMNLSDVYGVSSHVVLRRLYDIKKISKSEYNSQIEKFGEYLGPNHDGSGGHYFNNVLKYNSEAYCALVLEAYENGIISGGDFTRFTSLNRKFIPDLQKRIYGVD